MTDELELEQQRVAHEARILEQYDTDERLRFYAEVMGDGTNNIHFGKWDEVDKDAEGAYGKASEKMTDYMWGLAQELLHIPNKKDAVVDYVDLGAGTGSAAQYLTKLHRIIRSATCLNLCTNQNHQNRVLVEQQGLTDRIHIVEGTFERTPFADATFDLCFSQDAFVHAFSKKSTFKESYRITKAGGAFIFCDLFKGENAEKQDTSDADILAQVISNSLCNFNYLL